jgi:uncharacterized protein (DUF1330 family)
VSARYSSAPPVVQSIVVQDPDAGDAHTITVNDSRFQVVNGQLRLRDGIALDYEAEASLSLIVTATDSAGASTSQPLTLQVLNVNEPPLGLWLTGNRLLSDRGARHDVQIAVAGIDPDVGDTLSYSVSDPRLEIVAGVLRVALAHRYEFGGEATLPIMVTAVDGGGLSYSTMTVINVTVENEAPSALALVRSSIMEATFGATVGALNVADPDPGDPHRLVVSDPRFEIIDGTLLLKPDSRLDFEAEPVISLRVTATDSAGASFEQLLTLAVDDLPEAPTAWEVTRLSVFRTLPGAWIASLRITDSDRANDYRFAIDDPRFEVRDGQLFVRSGQSVTELAGERIPLLISIFDVAAQTTVHARLTVTASDSPTGWSAAHQWRPNPLDVNADGHVTPLDAALLIAQLNATGPSRFAPASPGSVAATFFDVSGDNALSPLDALLIINRLNSGGAGEAPDDAYARAVDAALQDETSGDTIPADSTSAAALAMLWNTLDEQQTQKQRGR